MMSKIARILVVDDDDDMHGIFGHVLTGYDVTYCLTGNDAIAQFNQHEFDVITLDVSLPDISGYDVCQVIRQTMKGKQVPILFVSGHSSFEERIKGYESGGTDYITKPFKQEELLEKVKVAIEFHHQQHNLEEKIARVQESVATEKDNTAKMYAICNFLQKSIFCKDVDVLCRELFKVTLKFGARVTLHVHVENHSFFQSDDGCDHKINNSVLEKVRDQGKIFYFGNDRAVFNWQYASLLVSNVKDDVDNFAMLMHGFEAGLKAIVGESNFNELLMKYRNESHQMNVTIANIFENMVNNIQSFLVQIGSTTNLTIDQEETLINIADNPRAQIDELFSKGLQLEEELTEVMNSLRSNGNEVEETCSDEIEFF